MDEVVSFGDVADTASLLGEVGPGAGFGGGNKNYKLEVRKRGVVWGINMVCKCLFYVARIAAVF